MAFFLTAFELFFWYKAMIIRDEMWLVVFLVFPAAISVLVMLNRAVCARGMRARLGRRSGELSPNQEQHLFGYATFYCFPLAAMLLSRFFSGIFFLSILGFLVQGYWWIVDEPTMGWALGALVTTGLLGNYFQVALNPMLFVSAELAKEQTRNSRAWIMSRAFEDLRAFEQNRGFLARNPDVVSGNTYWAIVEEFGDVGPDSPD